MEMILQNVMGTSNIKILGKLHFLLPHQNRNTLAERWDRPPVNHHLNSQAASDPFSTFFCAYFGEVGRCEAVFALLDGKIEAEKFVPIQFNCGCGFHGSDFTKRHVVFKYKIPCVITFFTTHTNRFTLAEVLGSRIAPQVSLQTYDKCLHQRRFRRGTYVFTDIDRLHYREREEAARLYRHLGQSGCHVVNDPALVLNRLPLLRRLHRAGINRFDAYPAGEWPAVIRFPVFVRSCHEHGKPLSDLLSTPEEVQKVIDDAVRGGLPLEHLIVVEYAAEEVRPGMYRKLAAFRIGDRIIPHTTVHDARWLVKRGSLGVAGEEDYLWEEKLLLSDPYTYRELLLKVFALAGIEYGRVDFGLVAGEPQIYEINTNPHLTAPRPHPFPQRERNSAINWSLYLDGVLTMDSNSDGRTAPFPRRKKNWTPPNFIQKQMKILHKKRTRWILEAQKWLETRRKELAKRALQIKKKRSKKKSS